MDTNRSEVIIILLETDLMRQMTPTHNHTNVQTPVPSTHTHPRTYKNEETEKTVGLRAVF